MTIQSLLLKPVSASLLVLSVFTSVVACTGRDELRKATLTVAPGEIFSLKDDTGQEIQTESGEMEVAFSNGFLGVDSPNVTFRLPNGNVTIEVPRAALDADRLKLTAADIGQPYDLLVTTHKISGEPSQKSEESVMCYAPGVCPSGEFEVACRYSTGCRNEPVYRQQNYCKGTKTETVHYESRTWSFEAKFLKGDTEVAALALNNLEDSGYRVIHNSSPCIIPPPPRR